MARGRGRYGLLLLVTTLLVAVQGALPPSALQRLAVTALASAALLLAFHAARVPRPAMLLAGGLVAAVMTAATVRALGGDIGAGAASLMNAALVALGPPAVAIGVVRDLRTVGEVRLEAVMGTLSLYILIGTFFGFVYGAVERFGDTALFGGAEATVSDCVYFSFTTLTTVGFGDLAPVTQVGQTLAVFEALVGQIYLVTIVSLIVGNIGRSSMRAGRVGERNG